MAWDRSAPEPWAIELRRRLGVDGATGLPVCRAREPVAAKPGTCVIFDRREVAADRVLPK